MRRGKVERGAISRARLGTWSRLSLSSKLDRADEERSIKSQVLVNKTQGRSPGCDMSIKRCRRVHPPKAFPVRAFVQTKACGPTMWRFSRAGKSGMVRLALRPSNRRSVSVRTREARRRNLAALHSAAPAASASSPRWGGATWGRT